MSRDDTSETFIDVESINLASELKPKPEYWKLPAAIAVLLIALTATLGTFGMRSHIDEFNAESRCRSELITAHELVRSEFDEVLAGLIIASAAEDRVALTTINENAKELYPRLQATREARSKAGETCAAVD